MDEPVVPTYDELFWPTLQAARRLGGSARKDELDNEVIEFERFTPEQQAVLKGNGPQTLLLDRLSWARSYLKGMGLMTNPRRGVWAITQDGEAVAKEALPALRRTHLASRRPRPAQREEGDADSAQPVADGALEPDYASESDRGEESQGWKDLLLDRVQSLSPTAFEHLAQRVLRESGFSRVNVLGRSNDGGIDGMGVYQLSLLSFPVFFQCKRYKGSVGSSVIRDFRGAMAGRGDKGLVITTGSFTSEAQREAKRDGAQPVDLIDGDQLCELLKELSLGVRSVERVVEDVTIELGYFDSLDAAHGGH